MLNTQNSSLNTPFGLYIHVPFCFSKCPYCDFYSGRERELIPEYADAVKDELVTLRRTRDFTDATLFRRPLASVYFGGGTPSLLPAETVASMLDTVRGVYALQPGAEITVEVNPTLEQKAEWFAKVAAAGVNRVSVGLQSALDTERKALGRRGTAQDAADTVQAAKQAGIRNISVDLMLGIPGQTEETLRESLDFALALGITHISAYILKIEPGTVFEKRKALLDLPEDDAVADLYLFMCDYLVSHGMRHYEISNFCFGDQIGRHNFSYWQCGEYLGIGPAAHSFINGRRFCFPRDTLGFIAGNPPEDDGAGGDAAEILMLALRTDAGLDTKAFQTQCGVSLPAGFYTKIKEYEAMKLVTYKEGSLRLTGQGFLLSNTIISALLNEI